MNRVRTRPILFYLIHQGFILYGTYRVPNLSNYSIYYVWMYTLGYLRLSFLIDYITRHYFSYGSVFESNLQRSILRYTNR